MKFIWYNPDLDIYQKGSMREYDRLISSSANSDRYDILYEFNDTTQQLMDKVLNSLNAVREMELETH